MKISLLLNFIISFPINIRQQSVILPIRSFCQSACHHHRHRPLSQVPVLLSTNAVNGSSQFVSPCPSCHDRVLHMSPSAESQSLCCWRIFFYFFLFSREDITFSISLICIWSPCWMLAIPSRDHAGCCGCTFLICAQ